MAAFGGLGCGYFWGWEGAVGGFEVGDALFEVAEVVDACLFSMVVTSMRNACCLWEGCLTCSMASLCISSSLQAGIISLSTPNSSFIFDLRLRSIRLCAVFLAIFLPAMLVELGCFFLVTEADVVDDAGAGRLFDSFAVCFVECVEDCVVCWPGFICMIFLDLVGGGGNEKSEPAVGGCLCWVFECHL